MAYTFFEFLKRRDPRLCQEALTDLGVDLSDPKAAKAFVAQLEKKKGLDLKQVAADTNANPDAEPDAAQLKANQMAQNQAAMQKGDMTPTGVKPSDWETSVGMLTPTGDAIPDQMGRGKPKVDVDKTLKTGMAQGALPSNAKKLLPPWLNVDPGKPPVSATAPTIDPKAKMSPADKAKAKSQPGVRA